MDIRGVGFDVVDIYIYRVASGGPGSDACVLELEASYKLHDSFTQASQELPIITSCRLCAQERETDGL